MDQPTLVALLVLTAIVVTYALEPRGRWFILAFAGACLLGAAFAFRQGAWPFGLIQAICSVVAARHWWQMRLVK